jgi:hypothetical protein
MASLRHPIMMVERSQDGSGMGAWLPRSPQLVHLCVEHQVNHFRGCDYNIEEQFRDTKGCRFGVRLEWTQFRTPQYLARFLLLVGVVLLLWTAVGHAVAEQTPSVRLHCKRKGPRLSLVRVGIRYLLPLAAQAILPADFIHQHLPAPQLRRFAWLQTAEPIP